MSMQINKKLLFGGLFSLLLLTACGNKGPLYQTPPQEEQKAETRTGEQDTATPQQEK
ncbi:lipoprotein [Thalassomonas viridans]|uniref:Lipoprotein n=1 Tax=Thalassomonas viridans TaxID=137584 RepID=A0AAE9Z5G3_9GAMM|nr:lipoprotein [Thalassomonas viridans]WDE05492.1 lipoprotein [Thalassomonas viridans]